MTVTQELSREIENAKFESLPTAAVQKIKLAIMDEVGIAFMAYKVLDKPLADFAKAVGGIPESTVIGEGIKVSCGLAAGVNAEMASHSDFEESGPGVHAFSPIAETAIAVAERTDASGKDIITAAALAYDINGRFARNLKDESPFIHLFPQYFRRHLILNSAICAAKLLGLNAELINRSIGMAWTLVPPDMKYIYLTPRLKYPNSQHNLWSAELGIQSALLVQCGYGGPPDIIENDAEGIYKLDMLTRSPSPYYYVTNELNFKLWIGSYGFMGGMQLTGQIMRENNIKAGDIEKVTFRGSRVYADPNSVFLNPSPRTTWEAVGCVPWSIANTVLGYEAGPDWLSEESLKDPARHEMAKKVKLEAGQDPYVNEVEIVTKKGTFSGRVLRKNYLGSALNPPSKEVLESKFMRTAGSVISQSQAKEMIKLFDRLETLKDIKQLTRLYKPA